MKLAIIGDSHAGRIKRTFDRTVKNSSEWSLTWFIKRSTGTTPLVMQDLGATHSVFDDFLLEDDLPFSASDYDVVLCIGMGLDFRKSMMLAREFIHPQIGPTAPRQLTAATWESALRDILANTQALRLVRAIREVASGTPIICTPAVRPMSWINTRPGHVMPWSRNLQDLADTEALSRIHVDVLGSLSRSLGVVLQDQPAATIVDNCWTQPQYGYGKFEDETDQFWLRGDYFHTNDRFATLYIDSLRSIQCLEGLPPAYIWPDVAR